MLHLLSSHCTPQARMATASDVTFAADDVEGAANAVQRHGFAVLKKEAPAEATPILLSRSKALVSELQSGCSPPLSDPASRSRFLQSSQRIDAFEDKNARERVEKVGHALHEFNSDCFASFSRREKLKRLLHCIMGSPSKPTPVQSLILCKQPNGGSAVPPHVDSTFLLTEPSTVIALWWALEDATEKNGCLKMLPGSHNTTAAEGKPHKRLRRDKDELIMEGEAPSGVEDESRYVPVEVSAGDCVIMHGDLWHMSTANNSANSRFAYTVHYFDGNTRWRDDNWLQRDESMPFKPL